MTSKESVAFIAVVRDHVKNSKVWNGGERAVNRITESHAKTFH